MIKINWPSGGMVDTTDLKSVIRNGCEGSNPSSATYTRVAQVVRAPLVGSQRSTHGIALQAHGESPPP